VLRTVGDRRCLRRLPALAALAGLVVLGAPAATAAPSVGDARQQAAQLQRAVDSLEVAAEQATEDYDGAQERLGVAVQRYLTAESALDTTLRRSSVARDTAAARVRALYESGGGVALYASAVDSSSITDALDRVQLANSIIEDSRSRVASTGAAVRRLQTLHARLATLAAEQDRLQQQAAGKAQRVRDLLATRQWMLAAADQRVRDLVAADRLARAEAEARAFAARLAAAREQALAAQQAAAAAGTTLPATITAPTPVATAAIAAARTRLGAPYVWGATGPDTFDCSGLTGWAYAQAGLRLPRTSAEQWYAGPHPSLAELAPGDLLFWASDTSNPATIHHVALYIGGGLMIAAPHTGAVVTVQPVYWSGYIGATRPTG